MENKNRATASKIYGSANVVPTVAPTTTGFVKDFITK